ncbi:MAG: hypothetical protein CBD29_07435 [Synechococcus sp. TMED169]|jgi:hypothetical protein|nr:MAG: hypothetical protein CBD29_07435 [Synechococcus sp. TMED169]|tara:strand:+ start:310 stop:639 length:330 start_codon:yes stop_codon:yes gene_type:complete
MALLLQFFGISDSLNLFHLEQGQPAGPVFAGFRPCQLDRLLGWGQQAAEQRCWDPQLVHQALLKGWLEKEELIAQWQRMLGKAPADRLLVAGLGTPKDWQLRCEKMFEA